MYRLFPSNKSIDELIDEEIYIYIYIHKLYYWMQEEFNKSFFRIKYLITFKVLFFIWIFHINFIHFQKFKTLSEDYIYI